MWGWVGMVGEDGWRGLKFQLNVCIHCQTQPMNVTIIITYQLVQITSMKRTVYTIAAHLFN